MPTPNYWIRTDASHPRPETNEYNGEIATLDIDGDNDLDFIAAGFRFPLENRGMPIRIMLNDGAGGYTDGTASFFPGGAPLTTHARNLVVADFNGDGRGDLFVGDHGYDASPFPGAQNRLLLSSGAHGFIDATSRLPQLLDFTHSAASGDIDKDGDADLLVMNINGGTPSAGAPYFLINDGQATFTRNDTLLPANVRDREVGHVSTSTLLFDADNDGDPDLLLGTSGDTADARTQLYLNPGNGNFANVTPSGLRVGPFNPALTVVTDLKAADLNGDGAMDLLVTLTLDYTSDRIQVLINNGTGQFTDETEARFPQSTAIDNLWTKRVHLVDINNDGFLDLFRQNASAQPIALNDGAGHFVQLPDEFFDYGGWGTPENIEKIPADVNGDGRIDVIADYGGGGALERFWIFKQRELGAAHSGDGASNGLIGDATAETLSGLGGDDVIFGAQGADTISGGDGADYLNGGTGVDMMSGGANDDTMLGGSGNDVMDGGAGLDIASYADATSGVLIALYKQAWVEKSQTPGPAGSDILTNFEALQGSDFNDYLLGSTSADILRGGAGNDELESFAGADSLFGEDGNDLLIAGDDGDTLDGGAGDDFLSGQLGNDTIDGADGDDAMAGGAGADTLSGGAGRDRAFGGDGNDTVTTGDGENELVYGDAGDDQVTANGTGSAEVQGGTGNDVIEAGGSKRLDAFGEEGNDTIRGASGNDYVSAGSGDDFLYGNGGADRLIGGAGNDHIEGGAGDDFLWGFAGADRFVFTDGFSAGQLDTIRDFEDGVDKIVLPTSLLNAITISSSAFGSFVSISTPQGQIAILVEDVAPANLSIASDFLFV